VPTEKAPASRVTGVPLPLPEKLDGLAFVPVTETVQLLAEAKPPSLFVTEIVTVSVAGVGTGVGVGVGGGGTGVGVGVGGGGGIGVEVGFGFGVGVGLTYGFGVGVGLGLDVGPGVGVGVGVGAGVIRLFGSTAGPSVSPGWRVRVGPTVPSAVITLLPGDGEAVTSPLSGMASRIAARLMNRPKITISVSRQRLLR